MVDIILDTLIDAIKILPFLFLAFLIIELVEHKFSRQSKKIIAKSGKFGPVVGATLGLVPQCGFSVLATNLYITRIITLGTLIAVYLSTSDEMLPILLSRRVEGILILKIFGIKLLVAILAGVVIDFKRRKIDVSPINYDLCEDEHCHCEKNILLSSLHHTFKTLLFISIITFILNFIMMVMGEDILSKIFMKDNLLGPVFASLVGLIPNCASSVMLTELFLGGAISFSSMIAGLLTGSGVALLVLFRANKNMKDNLKILFLVYFIGAISGIILELMGMFL